MEPVLVLRDVEVAYAQQIALKGISFEVTQGEIFGYLGPSGAGKTTTIKTLTQQLKLNQGSIQVFGQTLGESALSIYQQVGIMTDSNDVYDHLTVEENLQFFAGLYPQKTFDIPSLIEKIGLTNSRKKTAKQLSKGMRQRLLLATALVHRPKLLFLDEPTASLDPKTTREIHDLLQQINREGTTIFLTTHSMSEAEKLCHRIAFLDGGEIVEMGSCDDLKQKYGTAFIHVDFKQAGRITYPKDAEGLAAIAKQSIQDEVIAIHSDEPTLETIFLTVTGRETYEPKTI